MLATTAVEAQTIGASIEAQQQHGVELLRAGRNEQALTIFRELYHRTREPRALWRMGTSEAALGRWVDAEGHMSAALASGSDAWIRAQRSLLEPTLRQVQARVGVLTIRCNVPGAVIEVDSQPVSTFPVRLAAGDIHVNIRAEGYQPAELTITVPGNVESTFLREVELRPVARASVPDGAAMTDAPAAASTMPLAESRGAGAGPWVLVGGSAAAAVVGVVLLGLVPGAQSERDAATAQAPAQDADSRLRTYAYVGDGLLGAALVGSVSGLVWALTGGSSGTTRAAVFPMSGGAFFGVAGVL